MSLAEMESIDYHTPPQGTQDKPTIPYVAYGGGVIAAARGYVQAAGIESYLPEPFDYGGLPRETMLYRRLSYNSPASIDLRNKAAYQQEIWDKSHPKIIRGEE